MATLPPSIPVRQTTKSMYRPISKLNGDQLPMLRRVRRPELSGRITLYNHYTQAVLNNKLNVNFKQHEHAMDTIRKEQAQIFKSLCRFKKLQRRVQRDEHEERREEIRNLFKRQRRRQLMRWVVRKFRENVIKKRAERMLQEASALNEENKGPVLSAQGLLKYAGGFRRHTQPDVRQEVEEVKSVMDADSQNKTTSDGSHKKPDNTTKDSHLNVVTRKDNTLNKPKTVRHKTEKSRKHSKQGCQLDVIPELNLTRELAETKPESRDPVETEPLQRKNTLHPTHSTHSLPCDLSKMTPKNGHNTIHKYSNKNKTSKKSACMSLDHRTSHDSLIDQIARENTLEESDIPITGNDLRTESHNDKLENLRHGMLPPVDHSHFVDEFDAYNPLLTESEDENSVSVSSTGAPKMVIKGRKRRNMVKAIEKERAERVKARTRVLDEEPLTRYSRKPQAKVTAMVGTPKRIEFVPPSGKLRHEQDKLIRKEQDKDIQSQINIERFFHEVFQTKETVVYRQPITEEEPAKKPTLSLAGVLSQLYTPTENLTGDRNSMEQLKTCQYLRVYKGFNKKKEPVSVKCNETSWSVAEKKLRAGFMAISFTK